MMDIYSLWSLGLYLTKIALYIAFAMSIGGIAAIFKIQSYEPDSTPFLRYTLLGIFGGLFFATMHFFLQVGEFAESGLAGAFDPDFLGILWESGPGFSYRLRLGGWVTLLVLLGLFRLARSAIPPLYIIWFIASGLIAMSFTVIGHSSEQSLWVRLALIVHIIIAMWWMGSLYPLRQWTGHFPPNTVRHLMMDFSKQATRLIPTLLIAGLFVAFVIEGSFSQLLNSLHGNILMIKIFFVLIMLAIAALNKWKLVPKLRERGYIRSLRQSIFYEMGLGMLVLTMTAVLSTLVAPAMF